MFFLTFGNALLLGVQWLCEKIRYQRYGRVMLRLLRTTSVLVQRARKAHVGDLTRTSLLTVDVNATENVELDDDYVRISSLQSMQEVDLSSWTSYTSYLDTHNAPTEPDQDICVLLEARRPKDLEKFAARTVKVCPAYMVHVLSHGCPIAWKPAEPFGIILHCSFPGLIILTDAFGQGYLTLDEDLELIGLITVKTKGSPQVLVPHLGEMYATYQEPGSQADSTGRKAGSGGDPGSMSSRGGGDGGSLLSSSGDKGKQTSVDHTTGAREIHPARKVEKTQPTVMSAPDGDGKETMRQAQLKQTERSSQPHAPTVPKDSAAQEDSSAAKKSPDMQKPHMKPPNILIYCGVKDTARKFEEVKSSLEACINTEAYTVYHLKHDLVSSAPWKDNTALLIVSSCVQLRKEVEDEMYNYTMKHGGYILSFNTSLDSLFAQKVQEEGLEGDKLISFQYKDTQHITSVRGRFYYSSFKGDSEIVVPYTDGYSDTLNGGTNSQHHVSNKDRALVVKVQCEGGGVAILSQLLLERDPTEYATDQESFAALKRSNTERLAVLREILTSLNIDTSSGPVPSLTPCLILARRVGLKESFLQSFKQRLKGDILKSEKMSLKFVQSSDKTEATANLLPVVTDVGSDAKTEHFDAKSYWGHLSTAKMGQVVFHTDIITSTMTVFDGLLFSIPEGVGPIAIAGRQTSGKGRGGNAWLSPVGCAMFTLPLSVDLDSKLGQRVSFLQHVVSLAVVRSIVTLPGYENLNLRLKWPNDIYYGKEMKLGGVLVTSTVMGSTMYALIGCGFNVSNSNPTICINDIIHLYNTSNPNLPDLPPLNPSQLIARTVTIFEEFIHNFQTSGYEQFCELYYQYWLHGGVKVNIQLDKNTEGVIVGLDEYGFLSIRTPEGDMSVQPDGNTFDMMHNLIHIKSRA